MCCGREIERQFDLMVGMVLWGVVGAIAFFTFQSWGVWKWSLFTVPLGILAVIGVEVLSTMVPLGSQLRPTASFVLGALGILTFIVAAPVPQIQTQLLWFAVCGACAVITVELLPAQCARAGGAAARRRSHCSPSRSGSPQSRHQQAPCAHPARFRVDGAVSPGVPAFMESGLSSGR